MNELMYKREREKKMMKDMLAIYCHGKHHTGKGRLCSECRELKNSGTDEKCNEISRTEDALYTPGGSSKARDCYYKIKERGKECSTKDY